MRGSLESGDGLAQVCGIIPAHAGLTEDIGVRVGGSGDHPRACGAHISSVEKRIILSGSSPRMRGSRKDYRGISPTLGIIPAHAGLTTSKYLWIDEYWGSSPRMRGSPFRVAGRRKHPGIIPAHAGLTCMACSRPLTCWDHPRACGAHEAIIHPPPAHTGSSPRMRGSLVSAATCKRNLGIIPAHAGLTVAGSRARVDAPDHPRACGAHHVAHPSTAAMSGSSPRMRGSHAYSLKSGRSSGIIPAHAGLTWTMERLSRSCGAHQVVRIIAVRRPGSSPRMRGSLLIPQIIMILAGIIPAHAGLTDFLDSLFDSQWDHPRACGAHDPVIATIAEVLGSSPRMRGSPWRWYFIVIRLGIIPAHAGLTQRIRNRPRSCRDHPRACGAHPKHGLIRRAILGSSPRMRGSPRPRG